ncbi:hypothetical protein ANAEL_05129 [Anaerolineales bacterium]|nr:hypothetical protein ANAEL_05129 [Anaerolineales bacterium]
MSHHNLFVVGEWNRAECALHGYWIICHALIIVVKESYRVLSASRSRVNHGIYLSWELLYDPHTANYAEKILYNNPSGVLCGNFAA